VTSLPNGEALAQQFAALLKRIADDNSLDEDDRTLAEQKTKAVAEGLAEAHKSPDKLRMALKDAKAWLWRHRILDWQSTRRHS